MAPIAVTVDRRDPPVAVVTLAGEHDPYSAEQLAKELALQLEEGFAIVVDLRDAEFVDSTTLSVLLSARYQAEDIGVGFVLVLEDEGYTQVHRILDMTGLGAAFAVSGRFEDAVAGAREGRTAGRWVRV